jgi:hypothetical protein
MIQKGSQGLHLMDDNIDDVWSYGIDWDDYDNDNILEHHCEADLTDNPDDNPFISNQLERMTQVSVDESGCPLTEAQIIYLDSELNSLPYTHSYNMQLYQLVWISAIHICEHIFSGLFTAI